MTPLGYMTNKRVIDRKCEKPITAEVCDSAGFVRCQVSRHSTNTPKFVNESLPKDCDVMLAQLKS